MDIDQRKLLCLNGKNFTKFCIFITLFVASGRIGLLGFPNWYYQGKDSKKWKGGLFSVYSSGGLIKEKSYSKLSEHYCAEKTNYSYTYSSFNISYYEADSMCRKFQSLSSSSGFYVAFAVIAFIVAALRVLCMVKRIPSFYICVLVTSFIHFILEFISVIVIAAAPKMTFAEDCNYLSYFTESTNDLNTCSDTGAAINLFFNFASFLIDILIFILFIAFKTSSELIQVQARQDESRGEYRIPPIIPVEDPDCKVKAVENVD
jgi:hypothetical protein